MKKLIFTFFLIIKILPFYAQAPSLSWVNHVGGSSQVGGEEITVDKDGNVYSIGNFSGVADFDPGPGVSILSASWYDIFIYKTDAYGNFVWVKQFGGSGYDAGVSIELDSLGNIYASGSFENTIDFDPGIGIFNVTSNGGQDAFIIKLNSSGNLVWVKQFGGIDTDLGFALTLDKESGIYSTGVFTGKVDFDTGLDTFFMIGNSNSDLFILKLDALGNFKWATQFKGTSHNYINSVFVDKSGSVYTSGGLQGGADFDPGPGTFNLSSYGFQDIFISKLDSLGNFIWAKKMGNTEHDCGLSIKVDIPGNVYCMGTFQMVVDFDPGQGIYNLASTSNNSPDYFILKLDSNGAFVWAKTIGGRNVGSYGSMTLDLNSNIYTTGAFFGISDFDPGVGIFNLTPVGEDDIFVSKLDSGGNFLYAKQMGGPLQEAGTGIALDLSGNIYVTGFFQGKVDFDPNPGVSSLTAIGSTDFFLFKMSKYGSGFTEHEMDKDFKVYPNPTNSIVHFNFPVSSENYQFETLNNIGELINIQSLMIDDFTIDLTSMPNGLYFIKVIDKENRIAINRVLKTSN